MDDSESDRKGGTSCLRVQGKASVCLLGTVGGENKRKKAQVSGFVDSEQRTLWTSNSSLQVHPHLCVRACVCVISRATDGTANVCERREADRKCVGPATLIKTGCSSPSSSIPPPSSSSSFIFSLLSAGSISEGAGAAQREQVAAFKVVKTRESRKKRAGRGENVCV